MQPVTKSTMKAPRVFVGRPTTPTGIVKMLNIKYNLGLDNEAIQALYDAYVKGTSTSEYRYWESWLDRFLFARGRSDRGKILNQYEIEYRATVIDKTYGAY